VDDNALIESTLAGDTAAFGCLVQKYQNRLYNSVWHMVGSEEDARDIVQDAFVRALVKLESFQRTATFYTWLFRIAYNVMISRQRRERPVASLDLLRETSGDEPLDGGPAPHHHLAQQETVVQVRQALAALSDEHRAIVVLREIEGCDYQTIAKLLDLPVGTVRSRLHRARMQLRELLKQLAHHDGT
jgi:RNA polymerase sigma-70 factor (ECF subfamily)